MKILITDKVANKCIEQLSQFNGIITDLKIGLNEDDIINIIDDYQALIVRSATKVTKTIIDEIYTFFIYIYSNNSCTFLCKDYSYWKTNTS